MELVFIDSWITKDRFCTYRRAHGRTPQGEYRPQTPRHLPRGGSRADLMPEEEGHSTSWLESSTDRTAPL